jgi:hypothetical protein
LAVTFFKELFLSTTFVQGVLAYVHESADYSLAKPK